MNLPGKAPNPSIILAVIKKQISNTGKENTMKTASRDIPIYGIHAVKELLASRKQDIEHVYFDKDKKSQALFDLLKQCRKERLSYNQVPEVKLNSLAGTTKHQGIVAFCSIRPYSTTEQLHEITNSKKTPLLLVAASIEDPGNLGAIIRSCVCFGVDALLLERKNTVPLNAAVAKSSAGMLEHLCIVKPRNLEGLISDYARDGFNIAGAVMENGVIPSETSLSGPTILITGGEHRGIPPYLQKQCREFLSVPMAPHAQSLNASVAAAVLMYECLRQRDFKVS